MSRVWASALMALAMLATLGASPREPRGDASVSAADSLRARDAGWERDHASLAHTLAAGRDWRGAAAEFRRLAIAFPDSAGYAFDAATSFLQAGDSTAGIAWLRETARRPGAPPEVVRAVRELDRPASRPGPHAPSSRKSSGGRSSSSKSSSGTSKVRTGHTKSPTSSDAHGTPRSVPRGRG